MPGDSEVLNNAHHNSMNGTTISSVNRDQHNVVNNDNRSYTTSHTQDTRKIIRANETYARSLYPHGHGYPLWTPEPNSLYPPEYQSKGVQIGDVGTISFDGAFHFLFNICKEATHSYNQWCGVPEGFQPLSLHEHLFSQRHFHHPRTRVCSIGTEAIDNNSSIAFRFELHWSQPQGAALVLPVGAGRQDCQAIDKLREYAEKHAESWYRFTERLGHSAPNGSMLLVTGCDKTNCWHASAFSASASNVISQYTMNPAADGGVDVSYLSQSCPVTSRSSMAGHSSSNHTVFIRGWKIMLRRDNRSRSQWKTKLTNMPQQEDVDKVMRQKSAPSFGPASSSSTEHSLGASGSQNGYQHGSSQSIDCQTQDLDSDNIEEQQSSSESDSSDINDFPLQPYHPSDIVNKYLLDTNPQSNIALTHDSIWLPIIKENAFEVSEENLINRLRKIYEVEYSLDETSVFFATTKFNNLALKDIQTSKDITYTRSYQGWSDNQFTGRAHTHDGQSHDQPQPRYMDLFNRQHWSISPSPSPLIAPLPTPLNTPLPTPPLPTQPLPTPPLPTPRPTPPLPSEPSLYDPYPLQQDPYYQQDVLFGQIFPEATEPKDHDPPHENANSSTSTNHDGS
ncbi:hypothetical protein VKT23_011731 [Stygiomarasmius scandens]|uniref:Uncharacterized protein n=1 Tax=Marasmiellus scandens TaxID=2682957 RepID=A0ABR1J8D2_9AGAR